MFSLSLMKEKKELRKNKQKTLQCLQANKQQGVQKKHKFFF